jgi:P-loop containing NTP hydrolase pore-1
MVRLGLWGTGNTAFADFASFLQAISQRGVAALELVAMDLKAQGVYVARTLSFAGAWPLFVPLAGTPPLNAVGCQPVPACVRKARHCGCRRRVRGEGGGAG